MVQPNNSTLKCIVCHKTHPKGGLVPSEMIRGPVEDLIRADYPEWNDKSRICQLDLSKYRTRHIQEILKIEKGELTDLEREVVESLNRQELLSSNVDLEFEQQLTLGDRMADGLAKFGGSWKFILLFGFFLVVWILINSLALLRRPMDPYPYILLNLVLSCLAAIQAPIILMSQNRQEAKDRMRSQNDYQVNLKAELEIRHLHEKIDHILSRQWDRLMEIQEMQVEILNEMMAKKIP